MVELETVAVDEAVVTGTVEVATGVLPVAMPGFVFEASVPETGALTIGVVTGVPTAGALVTGVLELTAGVVVATVPHAPSVFAKSPLVMRTQ